MIRDSKFWISLAVFQVAFGAAVFALTRAYYADEPAPRPIAAPAGEEIVVWPGAATAAGPALPLSPPTPAIPESPTEISRRADEAFATRDFEAAMALYRRLLDFDPSNVEVLNNLGLTLHYLGRSDEALERLNEGVAFDPSYQRIWLTLGYVNSQLGNTDQARTALQRALETGDDDAVRTSAREMLERLP